VDWMRKKGGGYGPAASQATSQKPLARSDELVVEELGDELLVYDLNDHQAHSLSATASRVWRACDGNRDSAALGTELGLDGETIERALDELRGCDLLEDQAGLTRRDLSVKAAKIGGAAAAAPLIVSLAAPLPSAAQTPSVEFCLHGQTTNGCGIECMNLRCCCCCQSILPANEPFLCHGATKCCLPTAQCCGGVFGPEANCSDTNMDAGCPNGNTGTCMS